MRNFTKTLCSGFVGLVEKTNTEYWEKYHSGTLPEDFPEYNWEIISPEKYFSENGRDIFYALALFGDGTRLPLPWFLGVFFPEQGRIKKRLSYAIYDSKAKTTYYEVATIAKRIRSENLSAQEKKLQDCLANPGIDAGLTNCYCDYRDDAKKYQKDFISYDDWLRNTKKVVLPYLNEYKKYYNEKLRICYPECEWCIHESAICQHGDYAHCGDKPKNYSEWIVIVQGGNK